MQIDEWYYLGMDNKILFTAFVALVVGAGAGYMFGTNTDTAIDIPKENVSHGTMHGAMSSMTSSLEGKTGEEFDKAFLAEMIVHHEGAVAMAKLALEHSSHQEIKTMANAIISAQTSEIEQMKFWQNTWYSSE